MLALGPKLSNRPALLDLSVALAFAGLAVMALQFMLAGRIKILNRPFGTDLVYHFHRQIGIASFFMVFSHPILLFILDSRYLRLLNIFTSPLRAKAAVTSLFFLIGVVWTAEYRQKIKMPYKHWKILHGIFSIVMIALAVVHILLAGNYINLPWKQALWIAYSTGFVGILIYTRIIYPLKLIRKSFIVKDIKPEPGDVMTVTMEPDGHEGFKFSPGQFAWLTAWKTPFSDTEHPFSIASSAEKTGVIQMSIKKFGEFTARIRTLKPGERVYVDGPYGAFNLDRFPTAEKLVFIPGGIGVTPIMSMLRTMADRKDKRPILLFYCNREWDTLAFSEEIQELENSLNLTTIYTIEKPPQNWNGESGFLNRDILNKHTPADWISDETDVFLCGPTPMMDAVERELLAVGYSEKYIHTERYAFV
jgi:predicted ferric reductase